MKIKGTAHIKIYDPNKPGEERHLQIENYATERLYKHLYNTYNNGNYDIPARSPNHYNVFIAYRSNYTINKTGTDTRFTYDNNVSNSNPSGGLLDYGTKPSSQVSPVGYFTNDISIPYVQFYNRINPPTTDRTFNIIGLTNASSGTIVYPFTILLVEPECTQVNTEFIDVVYNLELVKGSSYFFTNQFCRDWVKSFVNIDSSFQQLFPRCSYCALPQNTTQVNGYEFLNTFNMSHLADIYNAPYYTNESSPLKHGKYINLSPQDTDITSSHLGFVINTIFIGQGNGSTTNEVIYPYYWETNPSIGTSPFQSKFNKKSDALYPFWEPSETPNASGDILFSGTWNPTSRFPEVIKVLIVNGGSVGTATYRIQIKKFVRLSGTNESQPVNVNKGNTWDVTRGDTVPFLNPVRPHERHHGEGLVCPKTKWKGEQVIMYDMTGITLINLYDGTFQTWDSSSTPALNVTQVCQCEAVPSEDLMYVACRATGLYRINVTTNTITRLNSDPCYGVCVGGSGKIYAVFNNRISNSDNWNTALNLVSAGITNGNTPDNLAPNWNRVRYIKANPWDTTDKLAIIIHQSSTNTFGNGNTDIGYVVWWSPTLGTTPCTIFSHTSGRQITSNPNAVNCHPSLDSWIVPSSCLVKWGSSSAVVSNLTLPYSGTYYSSEYYNNSSTSTESATKIGWNSWFGTPTTTTSFGLYIYYGQFYNGYVLGSNSLINSSDGSSFMSKSNTAVAIVGVEQGGTCIQIEGDLYLQWGFYLPGHYQLVNIFRTHATNGARTQGWIDYGWNGSSWVQGNTNTRITHTTNAMAPNGVNIRFVEGTVQNIPSFVSGQYMLQYMCNGILVDNTVNWYYEINKYFTNYVTTSFPANFKVPSSPNNGTYYEITLPKYKKVPQSNTYGWVDDNTTDGIDPDPLFYSADMQSKRSFNIALNGVSIPFTSLFYLSEKPTPQPMEICIQFSAARTDRILRFNAADAGKTITGTYVYMQCPS